jgi:hypothetical protein
VGSSAQWGARGPGVAMALGDASTMARAGRGGLGVVMPEMGLAVEQQAR